jgi:hypothetical protein
MENQEDKVWVTIERTMNLGNYESVKVIAGLSRTIAKNDPIELLEEVTDEVFYAVKQKSLKYKKELIKKKPL